MVALQPSEPECVAAARQLDFPLTQIGEIGDEDRTAAADAAARGVRHQRDIADRDIGQVGHEDRAAEPGTAAAAEGDAPAIRRRLARCWWRA